MTAHPVPRAGGRQSGVTLIELMIGLILIGVLIGMAVPSFRDWIINSQVRTATDGINDGIQFARTEAVKRNGPVRWRMPASNEAGWVVEALDRSTNAWTQVQQRLTAEGTPSVVVSASQSTITFLGNGFVSPIPNQPITFDVSNPNGGQCISQAGAGQVRCLRVTVTAGGQIRMCDPALPATNTTGC
jgi:type IV fimbrial biogenesis protein FimT